MVWEDVLPSPTHIKERPMNKSTETKIRKAIETLGDVSYRKIADEAGVSLGVVSKYHREHYPVNTQTVNTVNTTVNVNTEREHSDMETTINQAKDRIKARGEFPTTSRLVAETGYTAGEIDTYFEERVVRQGKRPLLTMMGYTGPLPARPYYGPIRIDGSGNWYPREIGEDRA